MMFPRRYVIAALGAVAASAAGPSAALADYPLFELNNVAFQSGQGDGVAVNAAAGTMHAAGGTPAGSWGSAAFCTPYAGTEITGFRYAAGAWHNNLGDAVLIQENGPLGTVNAFYDSHLPRNSVNGFGPWPLPGQFGSCVAVKLVVRTRLPHAAAWTTELRAVQLRDLQGPYVTDLSAQSGWITDSRMAYYVSQGDNALFRGGLQATIDDQAPQDLGDPQEQRVAGGLELGTTSDGAHRLTLMRYGTGWDTRTTSTTFRVDRNPPGTPEFRVDTSSWTNAAQVRVQSDRSDDGGGSGWNRNQYSVDGGDWYDAPNTHSVVTPGEHGIRVRAVDLAGHVSAPSLPKIVRIDRTIPTVSTFDIAVDQGRSAAVAVKAADAGGAGLGDCHAEVVVETLKGTERTVLFDGDSAVVAHGLTLAIPTANRASGTYRVSASVCDQAGNRTVRSGQFTWQAPTVPASSPARPAAGPGSSASAAGSTPTPRPGATPAAAGTDRSPSGSQTTEAAGSTASTTTAGSRRRTTVAARWWRPVTVHGTTGARVQLRGRLMFGSKAAPQGTTVFVRDSAGIRIARSRVRRDGAVIIPVRLTMPGALTVSVNGRALRVAVRAR